MSAYEDSGEAMCWRCGEVPPAEDTFGLCRHCEQLERRLVSSPPTSPREGES